MQVTITQVMEVELKQEAFTEAFMQEFRDSFFPFFELDEHACHIGQMIARGLYMEVGDGYGHDQFIEGYGTIGAFVKRAEITETEYLSE